MATCKALNIYFDISCEPSIKDAEYMGFTLDVKTTKYTTGHLLVHKAISKTCDIYFLVTGEMPSYNVVGFAPVKEVMIEQFRSDDNSYWVPQEYLKKTETFYSFISDKLTYSNPSISSSET